MTVDPHLSLNQLIQQRPSVLPVLVSAGLDTCCSGALSLEEAARQAGADLAGLVARLETETTGRPVDEVGGGPSVCSCGCAGT